MTPAYERLLYNRPVIEALHQFTRAADLQVWHDQIQYKPPRHGGINNWHQDAPYWPIIKPETPVTAWIALDDVGESNGCMWMVPGSHTWGNHIKMLESNPTSVALIENSSRIIAMTGGTARIVSRNALPASHKSTTATQEEGMRWGMD